ncbi:hypothetical protein THOM_0356 [Trachipleistophora hominis]|uniref:Uncharacterized protein n=1 Tax=Trachipleistophora hominis TaxID=72359 RepID=L7K0E2_TRAHO|nr:hypothetical protein THOM_0356 [Trachipleistophora hominis]
MYLQTLKNCFISFCRLFVILSHRTMPGIMRTCMAQPPEQSVTNVDKESAMSSASGMDDNDNNGNGSASVRPKYQDIKGADAKNQSPANDNNQEESISASSAYQEVANEHQAQIPDPQSEIYFFQRGILLTASRILLLDSLNEVFDIDNISPQNLAKLSKIYLDCKMICEKEPFNRASYDINLTQFLINKYQQSQDADFNLLSLEQVSGDIIRLEPFFIFVKACYAIPEDKILQEANKRLKIIEEDHSVAIKPYHEILLCYLDYTKDYVNKLREKFRNLCDEQPLMEKLHEFEKQNRGSAKQKVNMETSEDIRKESSKEDEQQQGIQHKSDNLNNFEAHPTDIPIVSVTEVSTEKNDEQPKEKNASQSISRPQDKNHHHDEQIIQNDTSESFDNDTKKIESTTDDNASSDLHTNTAKTDALESYDSGTDAKNEGDNVAAKRAAVKYRHKRIPNYQEFLNDLRDIIPFIDELGEDSAVADKSPFDDTESSVRSVDTLKVPPRHGAKNGRDSDSDSRYYSASDNVEHGYGDDIDDEQLYRTDQPAVNMPETDEYSLQNNNFPPGHDEPFTLDNFYTSEDHRPQLEQQSIADEPPYEKHDAYEPSGKDNGAKIRFRNDQRSNDNSNHHHEARGHKTQHKNQKKNTTDKSSTTDQDKTSQSNGSTKATKSNSKKNYNTILFLTITTVICLVVGVIVYLIIFK